jgi:hypothetical protein
MPDTIYLSNLILMYDIFFQNKEWGYECNHISWF